MKITHINESDIEGGAALAAHRLHTGLRNLGHDSAMYVNTKRSYDPNVVKMLPTFALATRVRRTLRRRQIGRAHAHYSKTRQVYEFFSDDRSPWSHDMLQQLPSSDILNLHWVANFIDYQSFFAAIPKTLPMVWTFHDLNAMTGGCHFTGGCDRFIKGCGHCPQLGSASLRDLSAQIWERKNQLFQTLSSEQLHLVAISHWMERKIAESPFLGRFPVTWIPNGVDTDIFQPRDRASAREFLFELPKDSKIILFVSASLTNKRKGFAQLRDALATLDNTDNLYCVSVGSGSVSLPDNIPHLHLGMVNNPRFMSFIYSAADVFVIPSAEDNLPNTVLESLACGTPVIGFNVGGIPDMVRPGITGELVPPGSISDLAKTITAMLEESSDTMAKMRQNCRQVILNEYPSALQAQRYADLYENIIKTHQTGTQTRN
jgi:glycosyltransferase involved in cell wall biosynthesis